MKRLCVFVFSSVCFSVFGQGPTGAAIPTNAGTNLNNNNVVGWNNIPTNLTTEKLAYSDVQGNCFWNQDWLPARVFMRNGAVYNIRKAKLNLHSQGIHFINEKGVELAALGGMKKIIFLSPNDTSKLATFTLISSLDGLNKTDLREVFAQVLVEGKIRFLKATVVKVVKRETDALSRKEESMFESRETYLIEENGKIQEMGGISKNRLYGLVPEESGDKDWLKNQNNKLKKEDEVVAFIAYRNSLAK